MGKFAYVQQRVKAILMIPEFGNFKYKVEVKIHYP